MRRIASCLLAVSLALTLAPPLAVVHAQLDSPSIPLNGIAHVAIRVKDLAASIAFYQKLGFEKAFDVAGSGAPAEAFVKINDTQFIELLPATAKEPAIGFLHVCFEGNDLEAIRQDYESRGLTPAAAQPGTGGDLLFTLAGPPQPFGLQNIEFIQYQPDSLQGGDTGKHLDSDRVADKLVAVALAMDDPDAARDFYINELNFKPISGDPMVLHMPGNSGQEIAIASAALGNQAHITLNAANLGRAARHLHREGVAVDKSGDSLTVTDPDGNTVVLETR